MASIHYGENILERCYKLLEDENGFYRNPGFLNPDNHNVEWIVTKDEEAKLRDEILSALLSPLKMKNASTLLLCGSHGVGKTFFSDKGSEVAEKIFKDNGHKYTRCRVNCQENNTYHKICREVAAQTGLGDVWASDTVLRKLRSRIKDGEHFNIVLDEAEMIIPGGRFKEKTIDHVIADLYELNHGSEGSLVLTCITNDLDVTKRFSTKTLNKYNPIHLLVNPPGMQTFEVILKERISKVFVNQAAVPRETLELLKAYAINESFNVKYALKILELAAKICEKNKRGVITMDDVRAAKDLTVPHKLDTLIRNQLDAIDRIVLYSIASLVRNGSEYMKLTNNPADYVYTGEVYGVYKKISKQEELHPLSIRRFGDRLKKLDSLGFVTLEAKTSGYGFRGNTTIVRLAYDCVEVLKVFETL